MRKRNNLNIRIQGIQGRAGSVDFLRAYGIGTVQNLALQVGEVDLVRIGEGERADAAGGQVERRGAAQAAGADDERVRRAQPLLPLDADLFEKDMTAVTQELLVVQGA